jgi:4-amino-4-deoxychorismate lyase
MCDDRGNVICGTRSNLFLLRESVLVTPELSEAGVAGVTRDKVLELALQLGLPCEVRRVPRAELEQAGECFVTNALIGLWPVRSIGQRPLVAPGPVTRELMQRLAHPWRGQQ